MIAKYNNAKISYKKLLPIANIIRKQNIKKALDMLRFIPNKGAMFLYKTIKSAVANANTDIDNLAFDQILCSNGYRLPRIMYRGRARVYRIYKQYSNIFIKLKLLDNKAINPIQSKENKENEANKKDDIKRVDIDNIHTDTDDIHIDSTESKLSKKDKNIDKIKKLNVKSTSIQKKTFKRLTNKGK